MDLHAEPEFQHRTAEPRWFVRPLLPDDPGFAKGNRWEIQFLDEGGRGGATLEFRAGESFTNLIHLDLPPAVIDAAIRGINDFVNADGRPQRPF